MKWFNGMPTAPACEDKDNERVPVPVGALCQWCEEAIGPQQSGFMIPHMGSGFDRTREMPWHRECHIRSIVGSVGHLMGVCECHGGQARDIEWHTKRQAAIASFLIFECRMKMTALYERFNTPPPKPREP